VIQEIDPDVLAIEEGPEHIFQMEAFVKVYLEVSDPVPSFSFPLLSFCSSSSLSIDLYL
tara:strand:- start:352 stop:528 length:177 start_codon:yes stop_codon:yes gene_type:complete